jgi:hypothetical protein
VEYTNKEETNMEYEVIGKPIVPDPGWSDGRVKSPDQTHERTSSGPFVDRAEAERTVRDMMGTGRFWAAWIEETEDE